MKNSPKYQQLIELGHKDALLIWVSDWRDGFGTNRTKQQRKSTTAWTISFSTPKDRVNSISNTFPIAVGLKKNPFWHLVEDRFQKDMKAFGNGPIWLYRGDLKKVVPCFVLRITCITDKVERSEYTSTLGCTSPRPKLRRIL